MSDGEDPEVGVRCGRRARSLRCSGSRSAPRGARTAWPGPAGRRTCSRGWRTKRMASPGPHVPQDPQVRDHGGRQTDGGHDEPPHATVGRRPGVRPVPARRTRRRPGRRRARRSSSWSGHVRTGHIRLHACSPRPPDDATGWPVRPRIAGARRDRGRTRCGGTPPLPYYLCMADEGGTRAREDDAQGPRLLSSAVPPDPGERRVVGQGFTEWTNSTGQAAVRRPLPAPPARRSRLLRPPRPRGPRGAGRARPRGTASTASATTTTGSTAGACSSVPFDEVLASGITGLPLLPVLGQ